MPRRLLPCLACLSLACAAGSRDTEGAGLTPTGASSSTAALTDDATEDVSTDSSETDATAGSTATVSASDPSGDPTTEPATTDPTTDPTTDADADSDSDATTTGPPPDGNAYLHVDLWSTFWNDRTRCGAERAFLHMCQNMGLDCAIYQQAYDVCDPLFQVYGQVGPEKQGEALCSRGKYPDIGGCVAANYDFEALRFWWYGAEWQGNWPVATVKLFHQGDDWTGGGELIALSNLPGYKQAAMDGIENHGLSYGCAMPGSSEDDAYQQPFGGFAWIQVPTGAPLTVVGASTMNFGGMAFAGCSRGMKTQDPWIEGAPGATLGCVHLIENMVFEPDHHYYLHYGRIDDLGAAGPPAELIEGFARPEVAIDITRKDACAL